MGRCNYFRHRKACPVVRLVRPGRKPWWHGRPFKKVLKGDKNPEHLMGMLKRLTLKKGVPVLLIRNIDQARGLRNVTRLNVINMGKHLLSCKILTGKHVGDMVFIPRMTLIPSNYALPIKF
ncbi:PREDICTED: uncharacterized protein LOC105957220 [Erythranthe guttata]|uniref:uncharacterized protein LOC105957220 n=1 Tax=Erythranthe guttata TaxID=4155 RepID=UPI00064DBDC1|nr:PREDICTED: uncharacterized protein LOC105957220 [Erythranthe guttata]|eukprot:XP_012836603.1 PREDICTED: uncharacterized protein LOC105957220 [Erythranthe guttata]